MNNRGDIVLYYMPIGLEIFLFEQRRLIGGMGIMSIFVCVIGQRRLVTVTNSRHSGQPEQNMVQVHFETQSAALVRHHPRHLGFFFSCMEVVVVAVVVVVVVVVVGVGVVVIVVGVVASTCAEKRQLWVGRSKQINGHGNNGS